MERYLPGIGVGVASLGSRLVDVATTTIKSLGTGRLVMGAFVVPFYLTTFAMCFLYAMDAVRLTF